MQYCRGEPWLSHGYHMYVMGSCFSPSPPHSLFVQDKLGSKYVEKCNTPFEVSYQETGPGTPVFFVLSPGVDPLKDVENLGNKLGFTTDKKNFHNISLGQGQEIVAENALDVASKDGHWVILQVNQLHTTLVSTGSVCLVVCGLDVGYEDNIQTC